MMQKFRNLLYSLSGAWPEILQECPAERFKFESLGWAILITSGMAAISMWFALASVLGVNPFIVVLPALAWGLITIVIDRWLITSMPSGGLRRLGVAAPRLVLALLLGTVISIPVVLRIFQPEINAQITVIKQQRASAFLAQQKHSQTGQQVKNLSADVANLQGVIDSRGEVPLSPSADPQTQSLVKQRTAELTLEQNYYRQWQCQLHGGPGCLAGDGQLAQVAEASYRQAAAQVAALNGEIQQRQLQLSATDLASQQVRYQQASSALSAAQQQLNAAAARQKTVQQKFEAKNEAASGLLIRLEALNQLSGHDFTINSARYLLYLLFLVIACLPLAVKLLQQPGNYEKILQTAGGSDLVLDSMAYRSRVRAAAVAWPAAGRPLKLAVPHVPDLDHDLDQAVARARALIVSRARREIREDRSTAGSGPRGGSPSAGGGGSPGEPPGRGPARSGGSLAKRRYLRGQCPESIPVGKPFSLLASIVMAPDPSHAEVEVEPFEVPAEGRDVLLVAHAPGLRLLGDQRLTVHVPAEGDSRPVMFELRADAPGPRSVSITAWLGGSYLGELLVEVTAERDRPGGPHRDVRAEISTESTEGAVSLVVRYDPAQNAYRFEFRDEDNPNEVTSKLAYEPGPRVEQLVAGLDELAKGRSGYSAGQTRDYLVNSGAGLWRELVPPGLREQFWDRQQRIRQLTILADKDAVPWELLYPRDQGHDAGFLVEQFPVTRGIFGRRPNRRLSLQPARFVLPEGPLPEARAEIEAMQRLLDPGQPPGAVISALTPLQDLIRSGDFGLLHFACHNTYKPAEGSSITLGNVQFTPTLMTTAAIDRVLELSAPTIFMNACRTAGLTATYSRLDGWASKFLEAGAAAFIGSLWAVYDGTAREFAQEFYGQLQAGSSMGEAVMRARQVAAASQPDDPTWLAYTVYGNPRATISRPRP